MGRGDEQVVNKVLFLGAHPGDALAAASLLVVGVQGQALGIALVADGHDHGLVGDQVFEVDLALVFDDLGTARIRIGVPDLGELGAHDAQQQVPAVEDRLQFGDAGDQGLVLVLDLFSFKTRQPGQLHVQNGLGLDLGKSEPGHQTVACRNDRFAGLDQLDDGVDVVQGDAVSLENVRAILGLAQLVPGAPNDDLFAEIQERPHGLDHGQNLGPVVHQGQIDHAEGRLHGRVRIQLVQDDLGKGLFFELDHDAHAFAVALVPQIADSLDHPAAHQGGDLFDQRGFVHLVRDFGDDDAAAPVVHHLDIRLGPHHHPAATRGHIIENPPAAVDDAAGREIRTLHIFQDLVGLHVRLVQQGEKSGADLTQVVGGDLGRHAYGNAVGPVDQQVGHPGRHDRRHYAGTVVVGNEVDGFLVQIAHQLGGEFRQAGFGVPLGGRVVPVDRTEVPLAVDQGIAQAEILGQPHQGIVHGGRAVRMIVARGVAGDLG